MNKYTTDLDISTTSIESAPGYIGDHKKNIKYTYIIVSLLNSVLGLYILYNYQITFKTIASNIIFKYYIFVFTFHWPISFVIGTMFAAIIYVSRLLFLCVTCPTPIKEDSNDFNIFGYIMTLLMIIVLLLHISAIPIGIKILYEFLKINDFEFNKKFAAFYLFTLSNLIMSCMIFFTFFIFLICVKNESKKFDNKVDRKFLEGIEKEIENANKSSGVFSHDDDKSKSAIALNK